MDRPPENRAVWGLDLALNGLLLVQVLLSVAVGPVAVWVGFKAVQAGLFGGFLLLPASALVTVLAFAALGGAVVSVWLDARGYPKREVERVAARARGQAMLVAQIGIYGVGGAVAVLFLEFMDALF